MTTAKSHKSRTAGAGRPRDNSRKLQTATEVLTAPPPSTADVPPPSADLPAEAKAALAAVAKQVLEGADPAKAIPQELPAERQTWYRPPDSKIRKKVEKILVMRAAGRSDREIAKKLGTTEQTIRQDIYIAKRNGWLDEDGEPIDLEAELALNIERKVVRNISASLDGQMTNWQTHEMTLAAAKGRGIFKSEHKVDVTQNGMQVVQIQVVRPADGPALTSAVEALPLDSVGGAPAYLEGEVVCDPQATSKQLSPGTTTSTGI